MFRAKRSRGFSGEYWATLETMRREPDFFDDQELALIYIARRLNEALALVLNRNSTSELGIEMSPASQAQAIFNGDWFPKARQSPRPGLN